MHVRNDFLLLKLFIFPKFWSISVAQMDKWHECIQLKVKLISFSEPMHACSFYSLSWTSPSVTTGSHLNLTCSGQGLRHWKLKQEANRARELLSTTLIQYSILHSAGPGLSVAQWYSLSSTVIVGWRHQAKCSVSWMKMTNVLGLFYSGCTSKHRQLKRKKGFTGCINRCSSSANVV